MNGLPITTAARTGAEGATEAEPAKDGSDPLTAAGVLDIADPQLAQRTPLLFEMTTFLLRVVELATLVGLSLGAVAIMGDHIAAHMMDDYVNATLIGAVFYAGLAEVTGAYDVDVRFSLRHAWGRVLTAWLSTSMFMLTMSFLFKTSDDYSRGWALAWFFGGGVALCLVRAAGIGWMRRLKRQGMFNQRVAIFGAGSQGNRLARYILGNDKLTISLAGFFDDRMPERLPHREPGVPALKGRLPDLIEMIRAGKLDQVIVALPWSAESRLQEVVAELAVTPVRIRLAPDLASFAFAHRPIVLLGDLPVLTLFERPISGFDQVLKRIEDLVLGWVLLIVALPILLVAAIAIKLDSSGPIFFRQAREGFNNQHFRIWKFRTMRHESCETDQIRQATLGDPRITRVGRFLRRTSIDELPQLFNVLAGEMSLVGPRPHAPSTRAGERLFSEIMKTYAARHNVKPGITGWAQVSGWRGETDTEEKLTRRLEHDLYYIENWSPLLDVYILIKTMATLFFQRSAY